MQRLAALLRVTRSQMRSSQAIIIYKWKRTSEKRRSRKMTRPCQCASIAAVERLLPFSISYLIWIFIFLNKNSHLAKCAACGRVLSSIPFHRGNEEKKIYIFYFCLGVYAAFLRAERWAALFWGAIIGMVHFIYLFILFYFILFFFTFARTFWFFMTFVCLNDTSLS